MKRILFGSACLVLGLLLLSSPAWAIPFAYTAADTPLNIPPGAPASGAPGTTHSYINVSDSGIMSDLNVFIDLDHTFTGDLQITLVHGTTSVILYNQHGSYEDDITDVTFDDEASTAISSGTPPYGPGSFIPYEALSAFDGADVNGQWNLQVYDDKYGGNGILYTFRIEGEKGTGYIPEPGSLTLLSMGLFGAIGARFRKKRKT